MIMLHFYYITYSKSIENVQLIKDRIKQYDDCINFLDSNWFICTEETSQEVYNKISKGEFEDDLIYVMRVNFDSYWGRMQKTVWDWIKKDR